MIISRTPLRLSFVGGGSDMPYFYREHGGAVLSTSIDKYIYVTINKKFDDEIRLSYSQTENVKSINDIEHQIVRACLSRYIADGGLEITTIADIPSKGTGLGSSSSFTVAFLHCLHAYQGRYVTSEALGAEASDIEINVCGEPIGKQDQYAAAYGGFNFYEFNPDDSVKVSPLITSKENLNEIKENLIMFYTGITRSASIILQKQNEQISSSKIKQATLKKMVTLAYDLRNELQNNNTYAFGEILHDSWLLKKTLVQEISNDYIDNLYRKAIDAGAIGGKLLGAGAGGFLIFYAPKEKHPEIIRKLNDLKHIAFDFEKNGSQIIFYNPTN
jgi:D-glycero-alpha-D-manno-heptose-7-phosphate kinase